MSTFFHKFCCSDPKFDLKLKKFFIFQFGVRATFQSKKTNSSGVKNNSLDTKIGNLLINLIEAMDALTKEKNMNKQELIDAMANEMGSSKVLAGGALDAFVNIVTKTLKKKGEVRLVGFGTFTTSKRKATTGRNPKTGDAIKIAASIQPKFKAGKTLKDALN